MVLPTNDPKEEMAIGMDEFVDVLFPSCHNPLYPNMYTIPFASMKDECLALHEFTMIVRTKGVIPFTNT